MRQKTYKPSKLFNERIQRKCLKHNIELLGKTAITQNYIPQRDDERYIIIYILKITH